MSKHALRRVESMGVSSLTRVRVSLGVRVHGSALLSESAVSRLRRLHLKRAWWFHLNKGVKREPVENPRRPGQRATVLASGYG
jgi:hypothetical protein